MNFATISDNKFVASRSVRAWNKLNRCSDFVLKLYLPVSWNRCSASSVKTHVWHPPFFSAPAKRQLNGSNNNFLEADIVRNYGMNTRPSCSYTNKGTPLFLFWNFGFLKMKINRQSLNENLLTASLSMRSGSSVDRVPARCSGGHGFDFCRGLRIFLCPTLVSCWSFHLYLKRTGFERGQRLSSLICHVHAPTNCPRDEDRKPLVDHQLRSASLLS